MNKLLIVLLAVCLFSVVSTHAFVKRDAPTAADQVTAQLNTMKEQITELSKDFSKKLSDVLNPETLKKNANDFIDAATKTIENFKPAPLPADAKPAA